MNEAIQAADGSVTSPKGFFAAGVSCGLKKNGNPDLAVLTSSTIADACGVFTKNIVKGHSLIRTMRVIRSGRVKAVVVNSGNANACVGTQGDLDADSMAEELAARLGCSTEEVLTGSTGVIGQLMPMDKVRQGIRDAVRLLDCTPEAGHQAELAIMTTDTVAKEFTVRFPVGNKNVTISGMAKGSGMIHPDMATMISLLTTDCAIKAPLLQKALSSVADRTFNRVSVDGDTSVCDMVVLLANGQAGNPVLSSEEAPEYRLFLEALEVGCRKLARAIAQDGEGATKLIELQVIHAASKKDALRILQAVAKSPLVKTAFFGEDANWGRILTAAGYSGAAFNPARCQIFIDDLQVCADGTALPFDETRAKAILAQKEIRVTLDLCAGDVEDRLWTCDFSYDYIKINGSYRS
jgi:glutamate N-acetyltransferase/amino-acid N-acetyltransferase